MAIRKEVFVASGIAQQWTGAASDGLSLARAIKDMGLTVQYAPRCIATSIESTHFRDVLEWTNRQAIISHIYMPEFWRFTAVAHVVSTLVLLATVAFGGAAFSLFGVVIPIAIYLGLLQANALTTLRAVEVVLEEPWRSMAKRQRWRLLLAAPVATWLYGLNVVNSTVRRTITWRGIRYELVGPNQTRVCS